MMLQRPRLAYAQARMLARLAALPTAAEWQRLAGARTLAAYLEEARATGLNDWVQGFSGLSGPHDLDRGCRALARESTRVTADWAPPAWRAAIQWLGWLPWLPVLEGLARGEGWPSWATLDTELVGLSDEQGEPHPGKLSAAGLDRLLVGADASAVAGLWLERWRSLWPGCGRGCRRDLEGLIALLEAHLSTFRQAAMPSAWGLREDLRERLRHRLHLAPTRPAVLFGYLAILFLDLERLRAALMSRAVFATA
ncbi:MAG: hypothetical protein EOM91_08880 [Sphingobacteriia bacterium]|nr:hypothetical protein [Sphingobacteriia bacterium]NCC37919.1 hypothetical protein [Gammaproteobacteria bacterium]